MYPPDPELAEILDFARDLAIEAEVPILRHYRHCVASYKADGSPVTVADKEAEALIRERLARHFPHAHILGEEYGGDARPVAGDQWIIDPIDGTAPYSLGLPTFGTLIGLLRDGRPVLGIINMPALGEMVSAALGHGCSFQVRGEEPQPARIAACPDLSHAYTSASGLHGSELDAGARIIYRLQPLIAGCHRFRVAGDCVQHALVCRGRLHLALDPVMAPWDSAALIPCIREAGGVAADLQGNDENLTFAGSLITACNARVLTEAVAAIHAE